MKHMLQIQYYRNPFQPFELPKQCTQQMQKIEKKYWRRQKTLGSFHYATNGKTR